MLRTQQVKNKNFNSILTQNQNKKASTTRKLYLLSLSLFTRRITFLPGISSSSVCMVQSHHPANPTWSVARSQPQLYTRTPFSSTKPSCDYENKVRLCSRFPQPPIIDSADPSKFTRLLHINKDHLGWLGLSKHDVMAQRNPSTTGIIIIMTIFMKKHAGIHLEVGQLLRVASSFATPTGKLSYFSS